MYPTSAGSFAQIAEEAELVWTMLDHAAKQLARDPHPRSARGDSAESLVVADLAKRSRVDRLHAVRQEVWSQIE